MSQKNREYSWEYTAKLVELAAETIAPSAPGEAPAPFLIGTDEMAGLITLEFRSGLVALATPFWEGAPGIPVQIVGGQEESFLLPFSKSGDLERDVQEYIRLALLIPEILGHAALVEDRKKLEALIARFLPKAKLKTAQGNLHTVSEDISQRIPRTFSFESDRLREQALFAEWKARASQALSQIQKQYRVEDWAIEFCSDGSASLFFVCEIAEGGKRHA